MRGINITGVLLLCFLTQTAFSQTGPRSINSGIHPHDTPGNVLGKSKKAILLPARLDSIIVDYMESHHIAGLSGSVVKDGRVIWTGALGTARFEPPIPVSEDILFSLASVSKTLTATALMQLYDQGEFDLFDPVNDYLPFEVNHPRYLNTDITFHMLLTHTSGIRDNWNFMPYYPGDSPIPLGEYLENYLVPGGDYYSFWGNFTLWEPGTSYSYCNIGIALVGYLVEVISGIPFDQYCQENLFSPLEMNESAWFLTDLDTMHIAMPYRWNGNSYRPYGFYGYSDYPSGQLRTSAPQLLRFLTSYLQYGELSGNRILDSTTVALMTTPQIPDIDPSVGLVWNSMTYGGRFLWGHGGGDFGVETEMYFCPDENSGVVILTNGESSLYPILDLLFDYAASFGISCGPYGVNRPNSHQFRDEAIASTSTFGVSPPPDPGADVHAPEVTTGMDRRPQPGVIRLRD